MGCIDIAGDNLREIILIYLPFIYYLTFKSMLCVMLNSLHFPLQIQVTYESVRMLVRALSVL